MTWRLVLMAGVVVVATVGVCAQEAGTAPATRPATQGAGGFLSEEELSGLFRDGKYAEVLRETGRILNAPAVLAGYDAFHVQLLRAECYLQLRNGQMAAETFGQAALVTRDTGKQALMKATAMVIKRSVGMKYVAKNTDEDGNPWLHPNERHEAVKIDLLTLGKRTAALKAMYADQWFVTTVAVEQARHSTAMNGYDKALKDLDELAVMEEAVVGKEEATQKLRDQTAVEMDMTIRNALAGMTKQVEKLQASAQEQVTMQVPSSYTDNEGLEHQTTTPRRRARGLTEKDARWLEGVRWTGSQVDSSAAGYAARLHTEKAVFGKSVEDAAGLLTLVKEVLEKNPVYTDSALMR